MKINHVLAARSLRLVHRKQDVYMPQVVEALRERYGFVRVPTQVNELLPVSGAVTFGHGHFVHEGHDIFITSMELFDRLLTVETLTSTADADLIMDDLLKLGADIVQPTESRRLYVSQLEVAFEDTQLEWMSPIVLELSRQVQAFLNTYLGSEAPGREAPDLVLSGLFLNADSRHPGIVGSDFRLERRANVPYTENVYFAQAPLRTEHHVEMIRGLDAMIRAARTAAGG